MSHMHVEGVNWFPNDPTRFVVWGSEINLYKLVPKRQKNSGGDKDFYLDLNNSETEAVLEFTESRYQDVRCLAPSFQDSLLTAVGLTTGKVSICSFDPYIENHVEFVPRQSPRLCLCVVWNENEKNLLACGYERNRSENSISIWDTEHGNTKEICTIGLSDTAHSLCWDKSSKLLYAGISHKNIKLIDPRSNSPIVATTHTRAVHGLSQSPNSKFLASYIDNVINIWDTRSIDKPLVQRQMQKYVNSINWCNRRQSVLANLQRDSPFVHLLDLHWSSSGEGEPHSTKRYATPFAANRSRNVTIKSISWHPVNPERMLAVSGSGSIIDFKVPQRISVTCDNKNQVWGTNDTKIELLKSASEDDISQIIFQRAQLDYGLLPDTQSNGELAMNSSLKSVWKLLSVQNNREDWYGIKAKLGFGTESSVSSPTSVINLPWSDLMSGSIKIYRSDQRDAAIALCGWNFNRDKEGTFVSFVELISGKGEYTRAAFIATIHLRIRYAIEILGKGADNLPESNIFRMAAIALSGFSLDKSAIWRSQCALANSQIDDPYLRVIFAFLAPENDNYSTVLNERGVSLSDRMAFACIFLNDQKLVDFVKTTIQICIEKGDLNGLLLTGASNEGLNLLQSYLDLTDDIQTVAVIAVRCMPIDLLNDVRVQHWISTYRDLLDVWELWEKRAQLDITLGLIRSPRTSKSVFLMCSFCGKNVSGCAQDKIRSSSSTHVNKLSSCPNCRKPLPRCSLCLLHMGTMTPADQFGPTETNAIANKSRPFSKWFSWCQTCRHGGHTEHLAIWFAENSECPVVGCSCKCFTL